MDINEWLAVKVMGYIGHRSYSEEILFYSTDDFDETIDFKEWNPRENIAQAFMCVMAIQSDKWNLGVDILISDGKTKVDIFVLTDSICFITHTNPAIAISTAIAKATGFKE